MAESPDPEPPIWKVLSPEFRLNAHRLLHWYLREPAVTVGHAAFDDVEKSFVQRPGDRSGLAIAYGDLIHCADRRYFCGRSGEEDLIGDVEHFPRNHLLDDGKSQFADQFDDAGASNAGQDRVAKGRGEDGAFAHHKQIFARAFADVSIDIEGNSLNISIQ